MLLSIPAGTTSKIIQIPIFDSSSTTGALLTGLVYNSAGLTAFYNREGAAGSATAITLATATKGTWTSGGFVAVDGTNSPGWYELHIPDAALASGAKSVSVHLKGATNMVPVPVLIELTATSNQDAVRGGMSALPNAAANAAGGLPISIAGALDLDDQKADINTILSQVANIAAVGTAVNVVAESYTLTTGTQTSGTYTSTALLDSTPHTHTDTAGTLDLYYQFDIGVQGLPSLVGLTAYSNGASDDLAIQAYNWGGATWETVGTLIGKSGSTYDSYTYTLLTRHVGTGANVGKVRIRFYSATLTSATLRIDQLFVSYATSQTYQYTAGIVNDAAATTSSFKTNLTQVDNFWNDALLVFTSGSLVGQAKPIQDFANTNGLITLDEVLTSAPANGDAFVIKAEHIHPIAQIVDAVWDEPLTGATHNIATSAGRRLRSMGDVVSATVNDAGATTTSFITTLTSAVNDFYKDQTMYFDSGSLTGASRIITGYVGATKTVTFDEAWPLAPGNGDAFTIDPTHIHSVTQIQSGLATAANLATLTGYVDTEVASILAAVDTEVAAIKAKTDNLPASPAATGDIPTVSQIWTTALTEAYRSAGAAGTAAQLLHEILQNLTEFSISGTIKTVKKFDASTTAKTYTLNSATAPTSITETT